MDDLLEDQITELFTVMSLLQCFQLCAQALTRVCVQL